MSDTPRDADAERIQSIRDFVSPADTETDRVFLIRQLDARDAALREKDAEIARLRSAPAARVVKAARDLLELPRAIASEELGGESYTLRYIQIESGLREALAEYDAAPSDAKESKG